MDNAQKIALESLVALVALHDLSQRDVLLALSEHYRRNHPGGPELVSRVRTDVIHRLVRKKDPWSSDDQFFVETALDYDGRGHRPIWASVWLRLDGAQI